MCGINGHINFKGEAQSSLVERMNIQLEHRGPDAKGIWSNGIAALGHTRLSIIDLSVRGNQPLVKDNLVIIFNGEIYNFKELKHLYLNEINFETESDTEVVLELWKKFGLESLEMLRGMFVFAIHDCTSFETFLVRDHFGIKPLFYSLNEYECIFSSELKALETSNYDLKSINTEALAASMLYAWIPENFCINNNVKKLAPGEVMHIKPDGASKIIKYWKNIDLILEKPKFRDVTKAKDYLGTVLEDSVKKHLVSDVPVNAFLSGGLDSSLLVAMASKHVENLECFTIKFSEKDKNHEAMSDDSYYAKKVADELGVKLNTIEIKPDLASMLPKIVHHLDEPIGDSAAINTFLICDAARNAGVKVLLSGMGADEIFGGYRRHLANQYALYYKKSPKLIRNFAEFVFSKIPVSSGKSGYKLIRWAKRFLSFASLSEAEAYLRSYTYYDANELKYMFMEEFRPKVKEITNNYFLEFNEAFQKRGLIDGMCYTDLSNFMVSLNLTYSDRSSMAASTEVRVPFIDKEVIKAGFQIDQKLKIKGGMQKYLLKKLAEDWLSKDIIYRPKASFTMPLRSWIKNDLSVTVSEYLLSNDGLAGRNIFNPKFLKKIIDDEKNGREDNAQKIWHLLTVEQWLRNKKL